MQRVPRTKITVINQMRVTTDQPGRLFAIIVLAPSLLATAQVLQHTCAHNLSIARALRILSFIFVVYEMYWIVKGVNRCYLGRLVA